MVADFTTFGSDSGSSVDWSAVLSAQGKPTNQKAASTLRSEVEEKILKKLL